MEATYSEVCSEEKGGRPVVKAPCFQCFHCQGAQFDHWSNRETKMLHAYGYGKKRERSVESGLKKKEI